MPSPGLAMDSLPFCASPSLAGAIAVREGVVAVPGASDPGDAEVDARAGGCADAVVHLAVPASVAVAMIVARILEPGSNLATARGFQAETLSSTLGERLDLGSCSEDEIYEAMDWLLAKQPKIEAALVKRHLRGERTLALADIFPEQRQLSPPGLTGALRAP